MREEIACMSHLQIMEPEDADPTKLDFDPFNVTRFWPRKQFPISKPPHHSNRDNFHRDVGQVAFSPDSLVPRIEHSPSPLLQFSMFLYLSHCGSETT
ncbi:hypothetical protein ABOM_008457 [Aspergillus bombycis]|uniref:Catalase core domain-containing protein n=1 Tax=Aspergillus bombycis TaxID=109264 RepID=A0A1F7ZT82_9EURO|nr:hypothetical protein ABOM_008457 [Aspergillus bombycis]OGM42663.1 hypothetical protein ABOM_008457 [Aspergillus bombycis]